MRFFNIPEIKDQSTENVLRRFIDRELGLDQEHMEFSVVHRIGAPSNVNGGRCILARFIRRSDIDIIKSASRNLKGTRFGISEDLPAEWVFIRKTAHSRLVKPAKQAGKQVRWRGHRLFIDGKEVDTGKASKPRSRPNTKKQSTPDVSRSPSPKPQRPVERTRSRRIRNLQPSSSFRDSSADSSTETLTQSHANIDQQDRETTRQSPRSRLGRFRFGK